MEKKSVLTAISILLGCIIIAASIFFTFGTSGKPDATDTNRFELICANDANIIIFDRETGRIWRKSIAPNEGPMDWTEEDTSFLRQ